MKSYRTKLNRILICSIMLITVVCSVYSNIAFAVNNTQTSSVLKQKEEKVKNLESEYKKANNEYKNAVTEKTKTETKIKKLQEEISKSEQQNYTSQINSTKSKLNAASDDIEEKNKKVTELKSSLEKSMTEYNKGSFGFFEYVGANDALNALKNCTYASYTQKGSMTDATNLDNMKDSFDYIRECNKLRAKEGKDPESKEKLGSLKVNDYLMATAQADANYSLTNIEHARQFGVGENLSWGYSDPFTGWYDSEKQDYLSGDYSSAGHYLNIVNSAYGVTGFAIAQGGSYGIEHAQTFLWSDENDNSMSVDEYEARFMKYYNKVYEPINKVKQPYIDAVDNLNNALLNQKTLQAEYDDLCLKAKSAESDLLNKKQELSDIKEKLTSLNSRISEKKNTLEAKKLSYQTAKSEYENAKTKEANKTVSEVKQSSRQQSGQSSTNSSTDKNSEVSISDSTSNSTSELNNESTEKTSSISESENNNILVTVIIAAGIGIIVVTAVITFVKLKNKKQ